MRSLIDTPLESIAADLWGRLDVSCRKAFFVALGINVLAFGFEMTNLTLHHDDVIHFFIQDTILGHYLGRPGFGWLHNFTQNHFIIPFLQMAEAMVAMSVYGVLVGHFWGLRRTLDLALVSGILCVFPYMGAVYQYNTSMFPFAAAHLLAALCVVLATRATLAYVAGAAVLFMAALSVYQAVAANAATIFVVWLLGRHLFGGAEERLTSRRTVRSVAGVLAAVLAGGAMYLLAISAMRLAPDEIHSSEEAFRLGGALNWSLSIPEILQGTRAFYLWPEGYFPGYLKTLQLAALAAAGVACFWLPKRPSDRIVAVALLGLAILAPRAVQLLHPKGNFHSLTLTAYAVVIAGAVMIVNRVGRVATRNIAVVLTAVLVAGYVIQCNWISTVNYLNTMAHVTTLTQVLARVRALPDPGWDGKTIAVVGLLKMSSDYPFRGATGVASRFMDASHMGALARLLRDDARFVQADRSMPAILEYAATSPTWPAPGSVAVVKGTGVVVFSRTEAGDR